MMHFSEIVGHSIDVLFVMIDSEYGLYTLEQTEVKKVLIKSVSTFQSVAIVILGKILIGP